MTSKQQEHDFHADCLSLHHFVTRAEQTSASSPSSHLVSPTPPITGSPYRCIASAHPPSLDSGPEAPSTRSRASAGRASTPRRSAGWLPGCRRAGAGCPTPRYGERLCERDVPRCEGALHGAGERAAGGEGQLEVRRANLEAVGFAEVLDGPDGVEGIHVREQWDIDLQRTRPVWIEGSRIGRHYFKKGRKSEKAKGCNLKRRLEELTTQVNRYSAKDINQGGLVKVKW